VGATCDLAVRTPFALTGSRAGAYTVDGALPTVLPGGGTIVEGNAGVTIMNVGVRLSAPSPDPVTVQWRTLELTGDPYATGSADYRPQSGQVTFAPNDTVETVQITINGDLLDEVNEQVWVSWHTATNAVIGGVYGLGYGIIRDDDQPPTVLPGLATIVEGNAGTADLQVPVSLSTASGKPVTVQWTTLPVAGAGFSSPPGDYTPASGVVNFGPGQTNKTVPVVINGDVLAEGDEYVVVSFRNPTNAVMGGFWGLGFGVIDDDD
jgi:Calx-beta domain